MLKVPVLGVFVVIFALSCALPTQKVSLVSVTAEDKGAKLRSKVDDNAKKFETFQDYSKYHLQYGVENPKDDNKDTQSDDRDESVIRFSAKKRSEYTSVTNKISMGNPYSKEEDIPLLLTKLFS